MMGSQREGIDYFPNCEPSQEQVAAALKDLKRSDSASPMKIEFGKTIIYHVGLTIRDWFLGQIIAGDNDSADFKSDDDSWANEQFEKLDAIMKGREARQHDGE